MSENHVLIKMPLDPKLVAGPLTAEHRPSLRPDFFFNNFRLKNLEGASFLKRSCVSSCEAATAVKGNLTTRFREPGFFFFE